jgi:hypothetical protein
MYRLFSNIGISSLGDLAPGNDHVGLTIPVGQTTTRTAIIILVYHHQLVDPFMTHAGFIYLFPINQTII